MGCLGRHVSADAGRFDARYDSLGHSRQAIRRCFRGRIRFGCLGPDGFGLEPRQDIGARVGFLFRPVRSADPQYGRSAPLARTGRAQRILHQDRTGTAWHFRAVRRDHESRLFRDRPKRRSGFLGLVLHVLAGFQNEAGQGDGRHAGQRDVDLRRFGRHRHLRGDQGRLAGNCRSSFRSCWSWPCR